MAVRTAYVATQSPGDILTSANFTKLPGGWIGYAEATSDQTGITTVVDVTSCSVTVTVGSNRRIKITGRVLWDTSVAADAGRLSIKESSTVLSLSQNSNPFASNTNSHALIAEVVLTPSSGSHTYKLTYERLAGSGTHILRAGATFPNFILVEDLGPSS